MHVRKTNIRGMPKITIARAGARPGGERAQCLYSLGNILFLVYVYMCEVVFKTSWVLSQEESTLSDNRIFRCDELSLSPFSSCAAPGPCAHRRGEAHVRIRVLRF